MSVRSGLMFTLGVAAVVLFVGCDFDCPSSLVREGDFCVCPENFQKKDGGCVAISPDGGQSQDGMPTKALTAGDDAYAVDQGGVLEVVADEGLLGNDSGPGPLKVRARPDVATAAKGVASLEADGAFRYEPPQHFWGEDSFRYALIAGDGSETTAVVRLVVRPTALSVNWLLEDKRGFAFEGERLTMVPPGMGSGDLNHDGFLDLVVGMGDKPGNFDASGRVYVLFGALGRTLSSLVSDAQVGTASPYTAASTSWPAPRSKSTLT